MRTSLLLLALLLFTACRRNPEESAVSDPTPPPAAALTRQQQSLDAGLQLLDRELSHAMGRDLESQAAKDRLLRAEAITDRLLETEMPFEWMKARDYSVEAMVRQIQALADRIVAKMRNGLDGKEILTDVTALRQKVHELRRGLQAGGGAAPLSLDTLLARYANDSTVVTDVGE